MTAATTKIIQNGSVKMNSYTNVYIGGDDRTSRLLDENALLDFKLKKANEKISALQRELENIPRAVMEWGFVDINFDNKKIRLRDSSNVIEQKEVEDE